MFLMYLVYLKPKGRPCFCQHYPTQGKNPQKPTVKSSSPFNIDYNLNTTSTRWFKQNLWPVFIWVVVSNIFYFPPYLGKIPILTNIFQMGWNYQPVIPFLVGLTSPFSHPLGPVTGRSREIHEKIRGGELLLDGHGGILCLFLRRRLQLETERLKFTFPHSPPGQKKRKIISFYLVFWFQGSEFYVWLDFLCFTCKTATSNKEKTLQVFWGWRVRGILMWEEASPCHLTCAM